MLSSTPAVATALLAVVLVSIILTERWAWARRFSAVLWILLFGALLTNFQILDPGSPVYGTVASGAVPIAVCLLLLNVRLSDVRAAGGPMIAAFFLAAVGTMIGVLAASAVTAPWLGDILGEEAWKLAGPFTGTYIGGSLNFMALWDGLEIGNEDLLGAANAVDNILVFPLLLIWVLLPGLLAGKYPTAARWRIDASSAEASESVAATGGPLGDEPPPLRSLDIAALIFLAVGVVWLSGLLSTWLEAATGFAIPEILIVTTLALVLGQFEAIRTLKGGWQIGNLVFYAFFAAVGALIDVYKAVVLSPALFVYVFIILVAHMAVVYGGGRLLRMDLATLTVASIAVKAGPALVPPLARDAGWKHLILPGVLAGLLGYALGNYLGFAVAYAVRAFI